MAPTIAIPSSSSNNREKHEQSSKWVGVSKMEMMKKRNEELEKELRESVEREEKMRQQLEMMKKRARVAEEAEELLCAQLGELEVESVEQARHHHAQLSDLLEHLSHARRLLQSHSIPSSLHSLDGS